MRMYRRQKIKARSIFFVAVLLIICISIGIRCADIMINLAQAQAKAHALKVINSVINEYIAEAGDMYNDMLVRDKSSSGNIFAVNTDIGKISRMQSEISLRINDELENSNGIKVKVSLANILGLHILTDRGITFTARMHPISGVFVNFEDSFSSAGINQTKFTVNLNVKTDLLVLAEPWRGSVTADHTVPVAQIILLGDVPNHYTSANGASGIIVGN